MRVDCTALELGAVLAKCRQGKVRVHVRPRCVHDRLIIELRRRFLYGKWRKTLHAGELTVEIAHQFVEAVDFEELEIRAEPLGKRFDV